MLGFSALSQGPLSTILDVTVGLSAVSTTASVVTTKANSLLAAVALVSSLATGGVPPSSLPRVTATSSPISVGYLLAGQPVSGVNSAVTISTCTAGSLFSIVSNTSNSGVSTIGVTGADNDSITASLSTASAGQSTATVVQLLSNNSSVASVAYVTPSKTASFAGITSSYSLGAVYLAASSTLSATSCTSSTGNSIGWLAKQAIPNSSNTTVNSAAISYYVPILPVSTGTSVSALTSTSSLSTLAIPAAGSVGQVAFSTSPSATFVLSNDSIGTISTQVLLTTTGISLGSSINAAPPISILSSASSLSNINIVTVFRSAGLTPTSISLTTSSMGVSGADNDTLTSSSSVNAVGQPGILAAANISATSSATQISTLASSYTKAISSVSSTTATSAVVPVVAKQLASSSSTSSVANVVSSQQISGVSSNVSGLTILQNVQIPLSSVGLATSVIAVSTNVSNNVQSNSAASVATSVNSADVLPTFSVVSSSAIGSAAVSLNNNIIGTSSNSNIGSAAAYLTIAVNPAAATTVVGAVAGSKIVPIGGVTTSLSTGVAALYYSTQILQLSSTSSVSGMAWFDYAQVAASSSTASVSAASSSRSTALLGTTTTLGVAGLPCITTGATTGNSSISTSGVLQGGEAVAGTSSTSSVQFTNGNVAIPLSPVYSSESISSIGVIGADNDTLTTTASIGTITSGQPDSVVGISGAQLTQVSGQYSTAYACDMPGMSTSSSVTSLGNNKVVGLSSISGACSNGALYSSQRILPASASTSVTVVSSGAVATIPSVILSQSVYNIVPNKQVPLIGATSTSSITTILSSAQISATQAINTSSVGFTSFGKDFLLSPTSSVSTVVNTVSGVSNTAYSVSSSSVVSGVSQGQPLPSVTSLLINTSVKPVVTEAVSPISVTALPGALLASGGNTTSIVANSASISVNAVTSAKMVTLSGATSIVTNTNLTYSLGSSLVNVQSLHSVGQQSYYAYRDIQPSNLYCSVTGLSSSGSMVGTSSAPIVTPVYPSATTALLGNSSTLSVSAVGPFGADSDTLSAVILSAVVSTLATLSKGQLVAESTYGSTQSISGECNLAITGVQSTTNTSVLKLQIAGSAASVTSTISTPIVISVPYVGVAGAVVTSSINPMTFSRESYPATNVVTSYVAQYPVAIATSIDKVTVQDSLGECGKAVIIPIPQVTSYSYTGVVIKPDVVTLSGVSTTSAVQNIYLPYIAPYVQLSPAYSYSSIGIVSSWGISIDSQHLTVSRPINPKIPDILLRQDTIHIVDAVTTSPVVEMVTNSNTSRVVLK